MIDISTRYLGLALKSPLVVSSNPLCESVDNIRRFEDGGVGAVVLPSLFEEQLTLESRTLDSNLWRGTESFPESLSYFPDVGNYNLGPEGYLELIRRSKESVSIPVIASLNGISPGGWTYYGRLMAEAGADAIELNIYTVATDPGMPAARMERAFCDLVTQVRGIVHIPVAVKLSPFFTAMAHMGQQLDAAGANGLVLFNRFYQPDFDIESLEVVPSLTLSRSEELLLRLHWVAILFGRVKADLAVTGGVHTAQDMLKSMMAGANVAMMASALLQNGIGHAAAVLKELTRWMEEHEYESIQQMRGSMSQRSVPNPAAFERGNYMRVLSSYSLRASS
jgi:dihydroorotate dehydrogenase (fumarate)